MMRLSLTLLGLLWVIPAISTSSDITEENYVVWPKVIGESGTFYLHHCEPNKRCKRKGYIQSMMPIHINMKGEKECLRIPEPGSGSEKFKYCKFVSANGVSGFIKKIM